MPANYIADFDSRPDTPYVVTHDQANRDYFDSEWHARPTFERIVNDDLRELDAAAREVVMYQKIKSVLVIVNRPRSRVVLKNSGNPEKDGTRYFDNAEAAVAKANELKAYFGRNGKPCRVWIAA